MPSLYQIHVRDTLANNKEASIMRAFLQWQGHEVYTSEYSQTALRHDPTGRKGVVMKDGKFIAAGLFDLVKYWNDNGLVYV